jgi:hypothetical protein
MKLTGICDLQSKILQHVYVQHRYSFMWIKIRAPKRASNTCKIVKYFLYYHAQNLFKAGCLNGHIALRSPAARFALATGRLSRGE